jgi:hypothetical protein
VTPFILAAALVILAIVCVGVLILIGAAERDP